MIKFSDVDCKFCWQLIDSEEGVAMTTTSDDLAGFWDLVGIQIEDVDRQFVQIDQLRQSGWKEDSIRTPTPTPVFIHFFQNVSMTCERLAQFLK